MAEPNETLTAASPDVRDLPEVVQRYLRFMGALNRPTVLGFSGRFDGQFRMGPGKRWMRCRAAQVDRCDPVQRSFRMRLQFGGVLPVFAIDRYAEGIGTMRGKALGLVTVADGHGPEFDLGELTTYLGDALLWAPSMLFGPSTTWTGIDEATFEVALSDHGRTSRGTITVDAAGAPTEFATDDRYADLPGGPVRARWRTPVHGWTTVAGRSVPTGAEAVWDLPAGPFTYVRGTLEPTTLVFDEGDGPPAGSPTAALIERASAEDLVALATDVGPAPMQVGAVLVLGAEADPERVVEAVGERIRSVPRLRQRLVPTHLGQGRSVWVDDADFELRDHVTTRTCPSPGDEEALLAVAADIVGARLPADRPLWRLAIVTGVDGGRSALVVAFHHVLADGIGGLAVLANLVDGSPLPSDVGWPRPGPSTRELVVDAARAGAGRSAPSRPWLAGPGRRSSNFVRPPRPTPSGVRSTDRPVPGGASPWSERTSPRWCVPATPTGPR